MTEEKQRGNLRATLALSQEEARTGTERIITLPDGRKVSLFVYPGAYNGQKIHLAGRGEITPDGTLGDLIITLTILSPESLTAHPLKPPYIAPEPFLQPSSPQQSHHAPVSPSAAFSQQQLFTSIQSSPTMIATMLLLVLMLLSGGGLVFYTTIYVPHKASSDATATAVSQATQIAHANATASAQEAATVAAINHATAVAVAQLQNNYATITASTPSLSDPLQTPYMTDWDINSNCKFIDEAYHVISSTQKTIALCLAPNTHFSNFAFQIHMNILKGDGGGIVFRADANTSQNYLLKISPDGNYEFDYYPDQTGTTAQALANDSSTSLKKGFDQDNTICVIAQGNTMNFYFNGHYITTVQDSSLASGQIGVTADDGTNTTEVAYTQAQVWIL